MDDSLPKLKKGDRVRLNEQGRKHHPNLVKRYGDEATGTVAMTPRTDYSVQVVLDGKKTGAVYLRSHWDLIGRIK